MDLIKYLIETFEFNSQTNKRLLNKISKLPEPDECIRHFSHLINSQYKWMARIIKDPNAPGMSWWDPVYPYKDLENEWNKSLKPWLDYLQTGTEEGISKEVEFIGYDGGIWAASPGDIALQLNYHSIHHRAQIQMMIRAQHVEPEFVDYIRTRYRKIR
jgi:uncharacterized damage-inducible protein DinB